MRIFLIKLVLYLCAWLPLPVTHSMGLVIGWGLVLLPNRSRHTSQINIALCWPELSPGQQRALVRSSLLETGKTIAETGALWLRSGHRTLKLIREVNGDQLVKVALQRGRGLILVTPHLGAWEAAGLYCAAHYNITCLYRPLKMPELEELVQHARSRLGGQYLPASTSSIRTLYKNLARGEAIAMLPDQEPQAGTGVFAPFFGVPAYSMVLLGRLAAKSGAPVIFVWSERLSWGRGYRLHFRAARTGINAPDIDESATATNLTVEDCVRQCPQQYQWSYRRFRTRPEGEPSFYKNKLPSAD